MARPPFDPYRWGAYLAGVALAVVTGLIVYAVSSPPNAGLAITGGIAAGGLLIALGNFLYGRSGLDVSLGGVVLWDVPKVRLTARVRGPRPIKPVDVLVKTQAGEWASIWDRDVDEMGQVAFRGIGDVLSHAGELIVDFRRDRLIAETGRDWPRDVRIVDSFGANHDRTFPQRIE
jgi:hypothetical protein